MQGFVSLTRPVVRHLDTAGGVGRMGVKGPLRILGMIADPATGDWPKLDVVRERDRINKGIDTLQHDGRVDFQWVPGGTGKDLMKKLLEGDWHIFHFIGHGGVDEAATGFGADGFDERGFVVMVDEDGKPVKKFASDLATMLMEARRSLRLIVLNCCESARINVGDRFGNPAIGLMKTGWLPAVVAMQFPITDDAAISMSEGFYAALAGNRPIDDALTLARKFIRRGPGSNGEFRSSICARPTAGSSTSSAPSAGDSAPRRRAVRRKCCKAAGRIHGGAAAAPTRSRRWRI